MYAKYTFQLQLIHYSSNSTACRLRWHNIIYKSCKNCCEQLAVESLTTACKCHGVSGSCSMKTCWKSLPDLRSVAVTLLDRYSFAVEVAYKRVSRRRSTKSSTDSQATTAPINAVTTSPAPVKRLVPVLRRRRTINDTDIVYYTMSPDYCLPDPSLGSVGTKDRYRQLVSVHCPNVLLSSS